MDKNTVVQFKNNHIGVANGVRGIAYTANVDGSPVNYIGRILVTQVVTLNDGTRSYIENGKIVNDHFARPDGSVPQSVDGSFAYNDRVGSTDITKTIPGVDSPGAALITPGAPIKFSLAYEFVTTLLYQPPDGIWVPLSYIIWGYQANATHDATSMTKWVPGAFSRTPLLADGNPTTIFSSSDGDFPSWSDNGNNEDWRRF